MIPGSIHEVRVVLLKSHKYCNIYVLFGGLIAIIWFIHNYFRMYVSIPAYPLLFAKAPFE
jgi:hypothetical protein